MSRPRLRGNRGNRINIAGRCNRRMNPFKRMVSLNRRLWGNRLTGTKLDKKSSVAQLDFTVVVHPFHFLHIRFAHIWKYQRASIAMIGKINNVYEFVSPCPHVLGNGYFSNFALKKKKNRNISPDIFNSFCARKTPPKQITRYCINYYTTKSRSQKPRTPFS